MRKPNKTKDEQARVAATIPILIKGKNAQDRAYSEKTVAEDVTHRGVFFNTQQALNPGALVRIYPAHDPARAIAQVEVVWVRDTPSGVGTRLVGGNRSWMQFLLINSIAILEDAEAETTETGQEDTPSNT